MQFIISNFHFDYFACYNALHFELSGYIRLGEPKGFALVTTCMLNSLKNLYIYIYPFSIPQDKYLELPK